MRALIFAPVVVAMLAGPAVASGIPEDMQGVWTTTAAGCDLYLASPRSPPEGLEYLRLGPDAISGATTGRFVRMKDASTFEASGSPVPNAPMIYELRQGTMLAETVGYARAAGLYLRCTR